MPYRGELHRIRVSRAPSGRRRTRVERSGAEGGDELLVVLVAADRRPLERVLEGWFRDRAAEAIEQAVSELGGEVRPDVPQGSPDERLDAADPGSRVQAVIRMDLGHERQVTCRYSSAGGAREGRPEEELR